ncbi:PREDICTED: auxin-induced protein 6B-like [Nelumbo nucifera]|uniref:Auxin-induced protein 6B-like n=1 Tax=Nelumbo nucifera TaxID=4432 RepID=A0A1U8AH13_NELNU|nr:PREDICTED: auxin-induced protein 6B-like [Nelumbo nucifera]
MRARETNTVVRLKHAVKKLQRGVISLSRREDKIGDVKEGHFAVFTTGDAESKKFFIALSYLDNPEFIKLLEEAEREFGFYQKGVIVVVPCQASSSRDHMQQSYLI